MAAARHRLLLVEDNEALGLQVVAALEGAGYEADWIRRGDEALAAALDGYSLVILDLMLPGASGFDVLEHLRRQGIGTPVLIASARNETSDKTRALDLGAIDYITKPFWPQELLDRVAGHLVHLESRRSDVIEIGDLTVDIPARLVVLGTDTVVLTRSEFDVLAALARRRGAAVSRAWLLERIPEEERQTTVHVVDRLVSRLKEKLGREGARITSVWGVGYRLED